MAVGALSSVVRRSCGGGAVWGCGAVPACQCDVAHTRGLLGAYQASIPILGSLGIPQRPPGLRQQPHIPFEQGGGGFGGCGCVLCVLRCCWSSPVEYSLKIDKIQLVN
jgi:hypothetical protein